MEPPVGPSMRRDDGPSHAPIGTPPQPTLRPPPIPPADMERPVQKQVKVPLRRKVMIADRIEAEVMGEEEFNTPWVAVLTHPHPRFGGDMDNNVVVSCVAALQELSITTIRFNFSGVGRSTGKTSWSGNAERDDVREVLRYAQGLREQVVLVAYSFGAAVALSVSSEFSLAAIVAIGYPKGFLSSFLFSSLYVDPGRAPKLFLLGDMDNFASVSALQEYVDRTVSPPKELRVLRPHVDHFMFRREHLVTDEIDQWLTELNIGVRRAASL